MSYLGKISAIVSANTADFSSRLRSSGKDLDAWARSMANAINQASSKAAAGFRNIYTEQQKLDRALQAATTRKLKFAGFEGKDVEAAANRVRALYSVSKDITGVMSATAAAVSKMSAEFQVAFTPALERSQKSVERLRVKVDKLGDNVSVANLGSAFQTAARQADAAAAAVARLKDAEQLAGGLATGRELRFRSPEFAQQMARAQAAQEAAATTQGGNFSAIIQRQAAAAKELSVAFARMEAARLTKGGDIKGATAAYQQQLAVLMAITAELEKATDRTDKRARGRDLAFSLTGAPQNLAQAEQSYTRLVGKVQELAAAQRKAFAPGLRALGSLIDTKDEKKLRDVRLLIRQIASELDKQAKVRISTEEAKKKLDDLKARLRGVSETITGKFSDPFSQLESSAAKAKAAIDRVTDAKRKAMLERRLAGIESGISGDAAANLTAAQLRARARQRAAQLDRLAETAGTKTSTDIFGAALNSAAQKTDALKNKIASLQSSIAELPRPFASQLIPQLNAVRNAFANLGPKATAQQIRDAAREADKLEKSLKRAQQAAKFSGSFRDFLNTTAADRYAAKLQIIQQQMTALGAKANGPVAAAINKYQAALEKASMAGTLGTERTKKRMDRLLESITKAAVAAGIFNEAQAKAFTQMVGRAGFRGDVGRMGVDKFTLGIQQLGFAVDDFFSSTGGFDQRIRAISNNISQFAFIVGGTKGLFIALGATVAAQAGAMVYKWVNGGKTAEDQTRALNDALARQKSLMEELSQAFRSLGDSLSRGVFSKASEEFRSFKQEVDEILKKRAELGRQGIVDIDPAVQNERATQAMIDRRLESETDVGRRITLIAQKRESERRERAAADSAVNAPAPTQEQLRGVLRRGVFFNPVYGPGPAQRSQFAEIDRRLEENRNNRAGMIGYLRQEQERQRETSLANPFDQVFQRRAAQNIAALEQAIQSLERDIRAADDAVVRQILEGGIAVNRSLSAVQELIDETVAPFSQTRDEAEKVGDRLREITAELEKGTTPERNAELQKEMEALKQQSAAYRSAAEVIRTFADTVKRISTDLVNAVEGETRSIADQARRDANRARAELTAGGEFGPDGQRRRGGDAWRDFDRAERRRSDAEAEAQRAQKNADDVRERNQRRREQFEASVANDPQVRAERKRLEELQSVIDSKDATEEQKARAAEEKFRIQRNQEMRFESSPLGREARADADKADLESAKRQAQFRQEDERFRAGLRGRDTGLTEGRRAALEAWNGLRDIGAAREEGMINAQQANEQASRFAQDQARSAAPAIFEMADAVQNAVLQGPSRQALEMTDVSTMEGSRELNRLLRGDDSAKNANIVELERQSQKLEELVGVMRQVAQNMGIVIDL